MDIRQKVKEAKEMLKITGGSKEYIRGYTNCLTFFETKEMLDYKVCQNCKGKGYLSDIGMIQNRSNIPCGVCNETGLIPKSDI